MRFFLHWFVNLLSMVLVTWSARLFWGLGHDLLRLLAMALIVSPFSMIPPWGWVFVVTLPFLWIPTMSTPAETAASLLIRVLVYILVVGALGGFVAFGSPAHLYLVATVVAALHHGTDFAFRPNPASLQRSVEATKTEQP